MTDRVAPGAQGSTVRNVEYGEMNGLGAAYVQPADEPTRSSQRWDELDETAFSQFSATYQTDSLTVTIDPGEAFVDGWFATDEARTVELEAGEAQQTIVAGWDADAVYSSKVHDNREQADRVFIGHKAEAESQMILYIVLWEFDTDPNGVVEARDRRNIGRTLDVSRITTDTVKYEPQPEPDTPENGCVRWYDETDDAYRIKFADGETVTIAQQ